MYNHWRCRSRHCAAGPCGLCERALDGSTAGAGTARERDGANRMHKCAARRPAGTDLGNGRPRPASAHLVRTEPTALPRVVPGWAGAATHLRERAMSPRPGWKLGGRKIGDGGRRSSFRSSSSSQVCGRGGGGGREGARRAWMDPAGAVRATPLTEQPYVCMRRANSKCSAVQQAGGWQTGLGWM